MVDAYLCRPLHNVSDAMLVFLMPNFGFFIRDETYEHFIFISKLIVWCEQQAIALYRIRQKLYQKFGKSDVTVHSICWYASVYLILISVISEYFYKLPQSTQCSFPGCN